MTVETELARYFWMEAAEAKKTVEAMPVEEVENLVAVAVTGEPLLGAKEFVTAVAYSNHHLQEGTLLSVFTSDFDLDLDGWFAYRPDLTEKTVTFLALDSLIKLVEGKSSTAQTILIHPSVPRWLFGVAFTLIHSPKYHKDTMRGNLITTKLRNSSTLPLIAKAKLANPAWVAAPGWGWVEKTETGEVQLLPHIASQVAEEFPELVNLPATMIAEIIYHLPFPDGFWGDIPEDYVETVTAFLLVEEEEHEGF